MAMSEYKAWALVIGGFLMLKDIPIGDFIGLVATSCGVAP
jgi:hypothetical protein